jgi:flagellar biosynthesis/type III secretory pathway protein FliH
MTINFLDPIYYDCADITDDMPNKELLKSLFERMNEQNERLFYFFTEMTEDPGWKAMKAEAIKPRQHRKKYRKRQEQARKAQAIDDEKSEEFEAGYKAFLKEEFGDS